MQVRLRLFAVLRDIVGAADRTLTLPDGATPADVWNDLRRDHPQLGAYRVPPMTAINQSYVTPDTALAEGDELAFIPPVSGG